MSKYQMISFGKFFPDFIKKMNKWKKKNLNPI